jgi:flavin-dependent dehydrogenase
VTFDVFIARVGPPGSYLGYLLARKGYRVAIADKEDSQRDKICSGGFSAKTLALLDFDGTATGLLSPKGCF